MSDTASPRRWLFVLTILVGSFLLFLVQPMVARMVLPKLGGAPAVWNSAMLVYQALLLGGYAYAHWLGRFAIRRQAGIHLALLVLAAIWLPIGIAQLPPPAPGQEALWVPLLLTASIGPVFFVVAALALLGAQAFSTLHYVLVPHHLCAVHGVLEDGHAAAGDAEHAAPADPVSVDANEEEVHDACSVATRRSPPAFATAWPAKAVCSRRNVANADA